MKKVETSKDRYVLRIRYWKEGAETPIMNSTMTTGSLRNARSEFRSQLTNVLGIRIDRNDMKMIVEAGYVVVAGPVMHDADRFAMLLTDGEHPVENPVMYAFEWQNAIWTLRRFAPPS